MCEGAGEAGARTGSRSATFTLSGQGNATLGASSHFFITLGRFGSSGAAGWIKGSKVGIKMGGGKRGCGLNQPRSCRLFCRAQFIPSADVKVVFTKLLHNTAAVSHDRLWLHVFSCRLAPRNLFKFCYLRYGYFLSVTHCKQTKYSLNFTTFLSSSVSFPHIFQSGLFLFCLFDFYSIVLLPAARWSSLFVCNLR